MKKDFIRTEIEHPEGVDPLQLTGDDYTGDKQFYVARYEKGCMRFLKDFDDAMEAKRFADANDGKVFMVYDGYYDGHGR